MIVSKLAQEPLDRLELNSQEIITGYTSTNVSLLESTQVVMIIKIKEIL